MNNLKTTYLKASLVFNLNNKSNSKLDMFITLKN